MAKVVYECECQRSAVSLCSIWMIQMVRHENDAGNDFSAQARYELNGAAQSTFDLE